MIVISRRVLIVDNDEGNRRVLAAQVESLGHVWEEAQGGAESLELLHERFDLLLINGTMPVMDGFELTCRIRSQEKCRDIPIIMVTELDSREDHMQAVEAGADDFITKPVDRYELQARAESLFKMKAAQDAVRHHQDDLERLVTARTSELQSAMSEVVLGHQQIYEAQLDTIHRLALAAEHRDEHTASHIHRVSHYCGLMAWALDLSADETEHIQQGSIMHDVGKIGIPDSILLKEGRLSSAERGVMEQHTIIGADILRGSSSKLLQIGEIIALTHHERWDGTGYPQGLKGEQIPLHGRICAVADVYDALTSQRPYKKAFARHEARQILCQGYGTHFDPQILDLFLANFEVVEVIQDRYGERESEEELSDLMTTLNM